MEPTVPSFPDPNTAAVFGTGISSHDLWEVIKLSVSHNLWGRMPLWGSTDMFIAWNELFLSSTGADCDLGMGSLSKVAPPRYGLRATQLYLYPLILALLVNFSACNRQRHWGGGDPIFYCLFLYDCLQEPSDD